MPDYESLPTEQPHPDRPELDCMAPEEIASLLLAEEQRAVAAVEAALPEIGTACAWAAEALRDGGRIVYVGAGTSGRLGVLDAAEMGPTFGAPDGAVVGLLAGAPAALTSAVEGAEDDAEAGERALRDLGVSADDLVIGISMSGTAAFVAGALGAASGRRVLLTANPDSDCPRDLAVVLGFGAEALAGSTRLKGGSATKTVLNMISTAAMAGSGAVYGPWMVRVRPTNRKLRRRAERLVEVLGGVEGGAAGDLLRAADDDVRVAVVMARRNLESGAAREHLDGCGGRLREALA
ncbi:MAG: N-acetylmuramic acid 6-phosphate etherase [Planctomycetota bacterium]|jgi:N-acetylmuramic acid 6-phosphate etherase